MRQRDACMQLYCESSCGKRRQGVVASTLNLFRNGACLLANSFGVGFIDRLDVVSCSLAHRLRSRVSGLIYAELASARKRQLRQ
jgi:hypothetical protein